MLTMKIKNRNAFERSLKELETEIRARVFEAVEAGGALIAQSAHERAPEKAGVLSESIRVEAAEDSLSALVSAGAPHARFVEFGTLKMPARPFLVPAAEENRVKITALVRAALNRAIRG